MFVDAGLSLTRDRLYPPEIMPLPFRAKGVSLSTATVSEHCKVTR